MSFHGKLDSSCGSDRRLSETGLNTENTNSSGDDSPYVLEGGKKPSGSAEVIALLEKLGVDNSTINHPPMRTVKDSKEFRYGVEGGFSKNLFLRNKKGKMWLVTLLEDREVDLKQLGERIGAGRVSFASEDRLMKFLGVVPGAVTPLAVINDHGDQVVLVVDKGLLDVSPLHFHPCDNAMTTTVGREGLMKYLEACRHTPQLIDFDQ